MKKRFYTNTLILIAALVLVPTALGQEAGLTADTNVETEKRAQTGMKFLSLSVDARAASLGSAMTAELTGSSVSMFYNPASMAFMDGSFHASVGITEFIADINYNIASIAYRPGGGNYGVFGLSVISVDYGDFVGTIRSNNEQGFTETGNYAPSAIAIGLGYARSFSDRFAAGGHIKYASQDIGNDFVTSQNFDTGAVLSTDSYSKGTIAFDFGIVYATGFRSFVFAMSLRNFSRELTYVRENFELPLTFQIGVAMDLVDFASMDSDTHSLMLHVDAQRPRDFVEHLQFGLEYTFMNIFSLRGGFEQLGLDEEQGVSLGGGLHYEVNDLRFGVDYAYTDFGLFGDLNRIAIQVGF